ncbi:MAG: MBL fold metallo-hydrolase [Desulfobacteraceae bacterium]|nr:MBL fold metallo-hydrolase [Desulfobacteraceae bacterium]
MKITVWGSRGSIPVSGREYLKYGGDTTCLEIRTGEDELLIVDAGTGIRRLGRRLVQENRLKGHFLFTHAHWDHLMGFPFFRPNFEEGAFFHMHRCPFKSKFVETVLSQLMSAPYFPVKFSEIKAELAYEDACPLTFSIDTVSITPVPISHPNNGSGYKFEENGKSFVFLTDNELEYAHPGGLDPDGYVDFVAGADLLIHDAEYTPEEYERTVGWGHSTYEQALDIALRGGVKRLGLFHLNQDRTDEQMDSIVETCRRRIREAGSEMECFAVACDSTFEL